jgi:hypothetical protein
MTGLSDYEDHLDMIDANVQLRGGRIHIGFAKPFSIALSDCATDEGLLDQVRCATIRMLDENINHTYLAQRIIRTVHPNRAKAEKLFVGHTTSFICDAVRRAGEPLRFENGLGQYAGCHYIELARTVLPSTFGLGGGPSVLVTRSADGRGNFPKTAQVNTIKVTVTPTHLVLTFGGKTLWRSSVKEHDWTGDERYVSQLALRHKMHADDVARAADDIRHMFEGLSFSYQALA